MYKIGNSIIEVNNLDEKNFSSRLELFRIEEGVPDARFQVCYTDKFDVIQDAVCIYKNSQFAVMGKDNRKLYCYIMNNQVYAVLEEINLEEKEYKLYLDRHFFDSDIHPYFLPSLLGLERLFIKQQSFVLHSSYIVLQNNGIVFTAPSGGGKSTQAELWEKYRDAIIVNGDKSVVCKNNNQWLVAGLPFSGSSSDCRNITAPLRAIIILQIGKENRVIKKGLRGFSAVFSQVTVNPWDKEFCDLVMDLVMEVCTQVPVYLYQCTKKEEAANTLYDFLMNEGCLHGIKQ